MRKSMRRPADVNMWPSGSVGDRAAKRRKRYTRFAQVGDERFSFETIGVKRDVHGIVVIEAQSVVGLRLAHRGHG